MNRPPLDLRNLPLRSAVGGYARADVEAFFERVAPHYEEARARLDELRVEHSRVMALLADAQEHERKVARVLSAAELASGEILARGRDTAAERIAAAERAGEDLLRAAEAERAQVLAEIERIRYRQQRLVRVLEAEIACLLIPHAEPGFDAIPADIPLEPALVESPAAAVDAASALAQAAPAAVDVTSAAVSAIPPAVDETPAVLQAIPVKVEAAAEQPQETVPTASLEGAAIAAAVEPSTVANAADVTAHVVEPGTDGARSVEGTEKTAERGAPPMAAGPSEARPGVPAQVAGANTHSRIESAEQLTPSAVSRRSRRGMLAAAGVAAVAILGAAAIPWMGGSTAASARPESPLKAEAQTSAVRTAAPTHAGTPPAIPPVAPAPSPAPAPDTLIVRLKATSECWVRLTAGSYSEERLLAAGETLQHESATDVVVRTGNAGALIVTVNGLTMAPLGGEGEVVTRRITRPIKVG
jgi:hypothetical protein